MHRGALAAVGSNGYNRSSIAGGTNWGELLGFAEDVVVPSDGSHDRQYGLPVRCLVYYFVRSGDINLNNGSLRDFGFGGYLWSASAAVYGVGTWSSKMYYLGFFPSEIHPSHNMLYRWNGFPVRCLV